jgi:hypothetical protein
VPFRLRGVGRGVERLKGVNLTIVRITYAP